MTLEKAIRLLREARNSVDTLISKYEEDGQDAQRINHQIYILNEIDAALAEPLDSATPVVEWQTDAFGNDYVKQGNVLAMVVQTRDGNWGWETRVEGYADTEAEAKAAAIAAARGMR